MFFLAMLISGLIDNLYSQQLPVGTCGLVYTYDASGNRLKRVYFCNNGSNPYPSRKVPNDTTLNKLQITEEVQMIDALYPNPTTGTFVVTFRNELSNATISVLDISGKVIQQFKGNGYRLNFDLSKYAKGTYVVKIEDHDRIITKKVILQ